MCVEDDVEFPLFANNDEFTFTPEKASAYISDEEILSDDEVHTTQPVMQFFEADNFHLCSHFKVFNFFIFR